MISSFIDGDTSIGDSNLKKYIFFVKPSLLPIFFWTFGMKNNKIISLRKFFKGGGLILSLLG
jgi:hypothetical protein